MITQYAFLILVGILALGVALLEERDNRIRLANIAVIVACTGIAFGIHQEHQKKLKAEREYLISLAQEVSAAQYITIKALSSHNSELLTKIEAAFDDGHIIWSEYGPIEEEVAARYTQSARSSALKSVKAQAGQNSTAK